MPLGEKLLNLGLDEKGQEELCKILLAAASQLRPQLSSNSESLQDISNNFYLLRPPRKLRSNIFFWRGEIPLISKALKELTSEAAGLEEESMFSSGHKMSSGGSVFKEIYTSKQFRNFVREASRVDPGCNLRHFYHFYNGREGARAEPHVDSDEFCLNVLTLLRQTSHEGDFHSALYLFLPHEEPCRIFLSPGESVIFYSRDILHCRTEPAVGEKVITLSLGITGDG